MTPNNIFFTKGVGVHKDKLSAFEVALRSAGIEKCNLVRVSSIFPPSCKILSRSAGLRLLIPGQITYCVMARNETNEPNRLISAAIGFARPTDYSQYGYLSEHHTFGEKADRSPGTTQKTSQLQCLQRHSAFLLTRTGHGTSASRLTPRAATYSKPRTSASLRRETRTASGPQY